jgi:hypothetical protein
LTDAARGDPWVLVEHRLLCDDATDTATVERLMASERPDVLWTDPPDGVDYVGKTSRAMTITGDGQGLGELLNSASNARTASDCMLPGSCPVAVHRVRAPSGSW